MGFLRLPDIDPGECLDYTVEFDDLIVAGTSLNSATVELESASPDESPLPDPQYGSPSVFFTTVGSYSPTPSPETNDAVVFWLMGTGLTPGTKYTFKVSAYDNNATQRCYVRRVVIKCKLK
jgi:hypothetical protein